MPLRKLLTLIFPLLFSSNIYCQNGVHLVTLKTKPKFPFKDFYISEVIDQRVVRDNIGTLPIVDAWRNLYGWELAFFPTYFESYLQQVLNELIKVKKGEPIILIIHEFNISEIDETWARFGRFRFRLEFAYRKDNRLYSIFYTEGSVKGKGSNIRKGHPSSILFGLKKAFTDFDNSNWKEIEGEEMELYEIIGLDFNKVPRKGLYDNFIRLAWDDPFQEDNYTLKDLGSEYSFYVVQDSLGKKFNKKIDYVSDGKDIFLNSSLITGVDVNFIKSLFIGKYIYFEAEFSNPSASGNFGVIGAIASNSLRGIILDTETGLIHILDKTGTKNFLENYPEELEKYLSSEKKLADRRKAILSINKKYNISTN